MGKALMESVISAVVGCFITLILIRFIGEILDRIMLGFMKIGMFSVSPEWQTNPPDTLINLFYIVALMPMLLGILLGILRSQMKTEHEMGLPATEEIRFQELR